LQVLHRVAVALVAHAGLQQERQHLFFARAVLERQARILLGTRVVADRGERLRLLEQQLRLARALHHAGTLLELARGRVRAAVREQPGERSQPANPKAGHDFFPENFSWITRSSTASHSA
jgi:hypothetical protein